MGGPSKLSGADADPVVVVGAGFAGLSAAVRLVGAGRRVILLEATRGGGGRSRSFNHDSGQELDNGQHLMMGCYYETLAFLRAIGAEEGVLFQRNLALDMVKPGGRRVKLRCPALPAPLHLAAGLLSMGGLGMLHKAAALRAGLLLRNEIERPDDNETCDSWLRRLGQTQGIRDAFWDPLIWGVLNDDPLVASAAMLVAVLERAFMGTRDGSRLGVPRVPLSRLYVDKARDWLAARGTQLRFGQGVRQILCDERGVYGVTLRGGEVVPTRELIVAVPPPALLDALPEQALRNPVFQDVGRLVTSPIVNLWLFLDRPLFTDVPFVGLVASPLHWLFDRTRIEGGDSTDPTVLSVTISGARGFIDDSPEVLIDLFRSEMARYFPGRQVAVLQSKVVKERRATISHTAGSYHRRPEIRSPIPGLWLAGDWVRTGLPATIESACTSGHLAAAAVLS